jgi:hypothetical protein
MLVSFESILYSVGEPEAVVGGVLARLQRAGQVFQWSTLVQEVLDLTWEECFVVGPRVEPACLPGLLVLGGYPWVVKALAA